MAMNSSQSPDRVTMATRSTPFIVGATSGALSTVMFQPLDLVKTRMQLQVVMNSSQCGLVRLRTFDMIMNVVHKETVLGLWKGVRPSLQRCVPGIGMYFGCMETFKNLLNSDSPNGHISPSKALMVSTLSRTITAITFLPITVVKARYESGVYSYRSVYHGLGSIWAEERFRGLFRGMSVTLARDLPFSATFYVLYSQSTQYLRTISTSSSSSHLNIAYVLSCGFGSGFIASVITQPFDVIKTKVQVSTEPRQGITSTFKRVISNGNGFRDLYTGLTPRVMRRTLMAAFTWLIYEEIQKTVVKYS